MHSRERSGQTLTYQSVRSPGPRKTAGGSRIPHTSTSLPDTKYGKVKVIMPSDYEIFDKSENAAKEDKRTFRTVRDWITKGLSVFAVPEDDLPGDSVQAYCEGIRDAKG